MSFALGNFWSSLLTLTLVIYITLLPLMYVSDETVTLGGDQTPFLYVRNQRLFFDTRTKLFFGLREFSSRMVDDTQYKSLVGTTSDY